MIVVGSAPLSASAAQISAVGGAGKMASATSLRDVQRAAINAAASAAAARGQGVAVDGMTSPTEQTLAMPDGTMVYEASTVPVRVELNGEWVGVDTTLTRVGDWFEPAASAAPVRFSPGGTDRLAQVQTETGEWVTERWPYGLLPAPTIDGDTATYPDVLPDVDLKMVATKTGQASIYVVKTERAALSTNLDDLHVIIEDASLATTSNGAVEAEVADGSQVLAGQPLWWDSSDGGTYREPGGIEPVLPVAHDVREDHVALDVGASVAAEERRDGDDVTYPIFVDPDWAAGSVQSWYTDAAFPNQSYLNASASDVLRMGRWSTNHGNAFFEFPLSALAGKEIVAAQLAATQLTWAACPNSPVQVRTFGLQAAGFTWNQQNHGLWGPVLDTRNPGSCGSGPEVVGWDVTAGVRSRLGAHAIQLGLAPQDENALSRRHFSRAATLSVTYNSAPDVPTNPVFTSPSRQCGTAASPAVLGQANVAVQVHQTDPDPGNVDTNFHLAKAANLGVKIQDKAGGLGAQGVKSVTFTGLTNGEVYAWRARGSDHRVDGIGFSAWCYFAVDTAKPAIPAVTAPAGATYTVGKGVKLSVTGAADVAGYVYWVTPTQLGTPAPLVPVDGTISVAAALPTCAATVTQTVRWACKAASGATTLTVAPIDSLSTLWVSAYDKAGNQSAAAGFPLYPGGIIGTPATSANLDAGHAWQLTAMSSPLPNTIPDSNPWIGAAGVNLIIPPTASTTSTDLPDPPVVTPVLSTAVASAADEVHSSSAPVDASKSFTSSLWLKPTQPSSAVNQVVAIQQGPGVGTVQLQITATGRYAFCLGGATVNTSSAARDSNCVTGGTVTPGAWQMVTGIWDATNQQLRLHVGNSITPVAVSGHINGSGDRTANGPLIFGPGPDSARFIGLIANPVIVPAVIDHAQLARLAAFEIPFTD